MNKHIILVSMVSLHLFWNVTGYWNYLSVCPCLMGKKRAFLMPVPFTKKNNFEKDLVKLQFMAMLLILPESFKSVKRYNNR